jgi:hypothetical protein
MPWQLIYTSAPRGLLSGQVGFCTVARSGDLREALAQRLEQISSYHYLRVAEAATANRNPTVCAFRILDLRGSKYYVLTRIQPCGLDFTARTNHLAHHLVFQPGELAQLPSPAAILRNWDGWLSAWQGEPRLIEDAALDCFGAAAKPFLPAQTWLRVAGDAGRAAGLLEGECARGCYLVCPPGSEQQVLDMFCETLQLLNLNGQYPLRPWRHPFTTFLQAEDNAADFHWRACQEGTPAHQQAVQGSAPLVALRSVRVPNNSLVKVAREGPKPSAPPPAAAPVKTALTLQKSSGRKPPAASTTDTGNWQEPEARPENPSLLDVNSAALMRIAVVFAVLAGLLAMKHWLSKKHAPPQSAPPAAQIQPAPAAPVKISRYQTLPAQAAPPDVTQLDRLSGDGPTYVFTTGNFKSFNLPMDFISRFQNLIQRFDHLETRPKDILLSLSTNRWDSQSETPMPVNGRETQELSAQADSGLYCSFNYSEWISKNANTVAVQTTFATPPGAFSVQFGFSSSINGDPFRLLIVNESNPPAPLHLSLPWLAANQTQLGQSLSSNFTLLGGRRWQLQPFISTGDPRQTNYLYKDWPPEDLPPPGGELDFAAAKQRLSARLPSLNKKADALAKKLAQQTELAELDNPLGKILGLTNESLTSLAAYAADPSPPDFIRYLNRLKKLTAIKGWPRVAEDDDEADLAANFQKIYVLCVDKNPDVKTQLMTGNTNYFSATWQNLKDLDKVRLENQRAQDDVAKFQARLRAVPDALDKAAYVGLFMIDPPKPGLEMIRFEGP